MIKLFSIFFDQVFRPEYLLVLAGAFAPLIPQAQTIEGQLIDSHSSSVIPSAYVCLLREKGNPDRVNLISSAITDAQGRFSMTSTEKNGHILGIFRLGYEHKYLSLDTLQEYPLQISLRHKAYLLEDIEVNSLKFQIRTDQSPMPVNVLPSDQIERNPSLTLSDVLSEVPSISLARDGIWGTSINLRGFRENRVVFLIDGARIETATDVAGALSMINPEDIHKVEVIRGASSSIYGSKAMGGVVQVFTTGAGYSPSLNFSGSATAGYQSANQLFSQHLKLAVESSNWFIELSGSNRNAGDLKTPGGMLSNSSFNDQSASIHAGFKPDKNQEVRLNFQYFHGWDIGIPGGALFPPAATVQYRKADRNLFSLNYSINDLSGLFEEIDLQYYHQRIFRDVHINPNMPEAQPVRVLEINPSGLHVVNGITLQGRSRVGKASLLTGIDLWQRDLHTEREKQLIINQVDSSGQLIGRISRTIGEKPLPDASASNAGVFMHLDQDLANERLHLLINTRIDYIMNRNQDSFNPVYMITNGEVNTSPANQELIYQSERQDLLTWGLNAGLKYDITQNLGVSINLGRSFRAPSLEELYKFIDLGSRVEYGNPDLNPERGYFADLGFRLDRKKIRLQGNAYLNRLDQMITLTRVSEVPFDHHQDLIGSRDGTLLLQNQNIDEALVYGFEGSLQYDLVRNLQFYAHAGYVTGMDLKQDTFLPMMPPFNGRIGIRKQWGGLLETDLSMIFFDDQTRVAEGETTTPGYTRYDLLVHSRDFELNLIRLMFTAGVENILNNLYYNHLTANRAGVIYEPGRNVFIKAKISW